MSNDSKLKFQTMYEYLHDKTCSFVYDCGNVVRYKKGTSQRLGIQKMNFLQIPAIYF